MKEALFIGRFQPFHYGHLSVLQHIYALGYTRVVIGIGSSQYSRKPNNPFTYDERKNMIKTTIKNIPDIPDVTIIALPDIHNDDKWVSHVNAIIHQAGLSYDVVFTNNDWVRNLFSAAGILTEVTEYVINISGTQLRKMIRQDKPDWKTYIEPELHTHVYTVIQST